MPFRRWSEADFTFSKIALVKYKKLIYDDFVESFYFMNYW